MTSYDVVIVGAGLAGLHAARVAARRGLTVLLADRKPRVDTAIHTTGIFVRRSLEDFALPEACLGPPVRRVRLLGPSLKGITFDSPRDEFRVGRMGRLYEHLRDDAQRAGATVRLGTRYTGSTPEGRGTRVTLESERTETTVHARYLFGADGASSRVASDLGLDENREWIVGVEDVYAARGGADVPHFTCVLDPHLAPGYVSWVVSDGDEIHVGVAGYADRFEPRGGPRRVHRRDRAHGEARGRGAPRAARRLDSGRRHPRADREPARGVAGRRGGGAVSPHRGRTRSVLAADRGRGRRLRPSPGGRARRARRSRRRALPRTIRQPPLHAPRVGGGASPAHRRGVDLCAEAHAAAHDRRARLLRPWIVPGS